MPQQSGFTQILFLYVPILAIFYFFIIRPQRQQQKKVKEMLDALKKNDEVMDSLQDLAIKVKTGLKANGDIVVNDPGKELDIQNLDTGIQLVETMIKAYQSRLDAIKVIKG